MPELSRRTVVASGLGSAGLMLLAPSPAGGHTLLLQDGPGGPLRSHFADGIGAVFTLVGSRDRARVRLSSIDDVAAAGAGNELCFTLTFTPLQGRRVPDGIWSVRHRGSASHDLFLSAVGRDGAVQAVVDRRTA